MKNTIRNSLTALVVAAGLTVSAHAALIAGSLSYSGAVTTNTGNVDTATAFTSLGPGIVTTSFGNFAAGPAAGVGGGITPGQLLAMLPFSYGTSAAPLLSGAGVPTWTITNGAVTTTFMLSSITIVDHNVAGQVGIKGLGVFTMTGFDATLGDFNFTANQSGASFSMSASQLAYAPDGGSTAILLGLGLGFLGFAARRFKAI